MNKLSITTAILLGMTMTPALAEPSVEVMHFWTSGGEAAALSAVRDKVVSEGVKWTDAPVAGGGGDAAKTALQARIASGNPPAAMLMLGQNVIDWANEGLLGNVDALAAAEGWDAVLPQAVKDFTKIGGHYVSVPTNVHRTDMIWASKAAFDKIGAPYPKTWDELNALAPKFLAAGIIPLAHGGQAWQEAYMFEAVALGVGGADFYRKALVDLDDATLRGPEMVAVFTELAALRGMVDKNAPGRDWNLASAMVINGEAAMQIMGDWAKGEFMAAGKVPGKDFLCAAAPGTSNAFTFNVDSFAMFKLKSADAQKAQGDLAAAIMGPEFQEVFNLNKGSIPVRLNMKLDKFDDCAKLSSKDFVDTAKSGGLQPSVAHGMAISPAAEGAIKDVVSQFWNDNKISVAEAQKRLLSAAKTK